MTCQNSKWQVNSLTAATALGSEQIVALDKSASICCCRDWVMATGAVHTALYTTDSGHCRAMQQCIPYTVHTTCLLPNQAGHCNAAGPTAAVDVLTVMYDALAVSHQRPNTSVLSEPHQLGGYLDTCCNLHHYIGLHHVLRYTPLLTRCRCRLLQCYCTEIVRFAAAVDLHQSFQSHYCCCACPGCCCCFGRCLFSW